MIKFQCYLFSKIQFASRYKIVGRYNFTSRLDGFALKNEKSISYWWLGTSTDVYEIEFRNKYYSYSFHKDLI